MNENVKIVFGLLGGLAIFLFGMNMMSESLQKAAGEKMRKVLGLLTKNPVLGVISGALVTAVLQSSSATTVMAIGFVSAGLMTLPQAISIIFGANIGTTMTAQIIAFKLSDYIYIIIFAGFMISFLARKQKIKYIGNSILAFGLLFDGIDIMGSVMKPLASSPFFVSLIGKVAHIPVLGVLVGLMMTLVVQSSSATIAVLQNFASQAAADGVTSIIGLAGAIPVLLGDNIGTTITAVLASIGQSIDAKRTALAHCIFNISGSLLFIWFVKPYAALITMISPKGNEVDVISRQIANAHTGFNVIMTLIWTPLLWLMVKIVMKVIPDKKVTAVPLGQPKYLDNKLIGQPVAALHLVAHEVLHCAHIVQKMLRNTERITQKESEKVLETMRSEAAGVHALSEKINTYLSAVLSSGAITEDQASMATGVLLIQSEIDRIADLCCKIIENLAGSKDGKQKYSKEAMKDIRCSAELLRKMFDETLLQMADPLITDPDKLKSEQNRIMGMDDDMRKKHMKRVAKGKCDAKMTVRFNALLHDLERMGSSCLDLSDTALKEIHFSALLQGDHDPEADEEAEDMTASVQASAEQALLQTTSEIR
ncbi:MAG: Na/Pi cotransporter family protein [Bilifractor sp.]